MNLFVADLTLFFILISRSYSSWLILIVVYFFVSFIENFTRSYCRFPSFGSFTFYMYSTYFDSFQIRAVSLVFDSFERLEKSPILIHS